MSRLNWVASVHRRATVVVAALVVVAPAVVAVGWLARGGSPAAAQPVEVTDGVAQTELAARAEAAASGEPVEVLAFRDERRDVLANPDGTTTVRQHAAPVRTVKDGEWTAVDPTLEVRPDGRVAPVAATVDVSLSGGAGSLVEVGKAGRRVSLDWGGGRLPEPVVDGTTATYPDVLPGVDLVARALVDGFSHTLVVKNARAAANPGLSELELPLRVDGAEVRTTRSGGVEIVDAASGGVMLAADAPTMWDSGGRRASVEGLGEAATAKQLRAEMDVRVEDDAMRLVPDPAVLAGPDVTYPVYIDPVYRDEYRSAWAMVDSGYPNEEYWKFDGDSHEGLGRCPVNCNSSQVKRLFYRMPTSFYDDKEILSAEFVAVLEHNWAGSNVSDRADLYLMNDGISSSTNWNNQPSGSRVDTANPPAPSNNCSGLNDGGTEWNVKPEVQDAADDGRNTLTFGLRNSTESDSSKWMRFCHNAHLRVRYNTPPDQPEMDDLSTSPGAGCDWGITSDSYVNQLPKLRAYLFDADHGRTNEWNGGGTVSEQLRAQFRLVWDDNGQSWTSPLSAPKASGSRFELDLATASGVPSLPDNEPIGWIVRAYDGHDYSPWSWVGSPTRCRFVIDPTAPDPPTVASADFPGDGTWTDKLGEYGTFTFSSASGDVVSYEYDFTNDSAGPQSVTAESDGTATVSFLPSQAGPHVLTVQAFDNASNSSTNSYTFAVSARGPVGSWGLADPAGSPEATDAGGTNPAVAGAGVTFGVDGPGANSTAQLDGSPDAWLEAPARELVDTGDGFAASAWVRVNDLTRDQTAVGVNGTGEAGFALGYHAEAQAWTFEIPDFDVYRFNTWRVTSPANSVEAGEWAHLVAVYDPGSTTMELYVNGSLAASGQRGSSWSGLGAVQLGRSMLEGHYAGFWDGDLAEVQVFDRVVVPDEVALLGSLAPQRQAYWQLNDAVSGTAPEYAGGPGLTLAGGATIYQPPDPAVDPPPLVGAGHLVLDGVDDYAAASVPVVDTSDSFTVAARVRLASAQPASSMTVLAAPGTNASMFAVGYSAAEDAWQLVVTEADDPTPQAVSVTSPVAPSASGSGQLIAVVYNAFTDQVTLYVDGVASVPVGLDGPWTATGGFQVGRSMEAGLFVDYLSGEVDEVRVYAGVADAATVQRLGSLNEQPEL